MDKKINFYTFSEFVNSQIAIDEFILIRHDVDRKPYNALIMAQMENRMGIKSTYYFRHKKHTFIPEIIKSIQSLGHEIGYHYENLSDSNGNLSIALDDFKSKLKTFRNIVPIKTISMHGKPLKKFDNRDMWKNNKEFLNDCGIVGEIYLDINYNQIAYISDTGRNWSQNKSNLRDKVNSSVITDFHSKLELIEFLKNNKNKKIVFQTHPERWTDNCFEWTGQLLKDKVINIIKSIIQYEK
ncbi:MAG: hypothetical protein JXR69_08100 [Candidatus Delongbacteria bacterium]|nr:hypothetical protein [Candidatus Delongbacteria bacterium]